MTRPGWANRDRLALLVAIVAPFIVTLFLVPFRDSFSNTNAALLLVLVIVAVAANGDRFAGLLAALSAALWFDFFLTQPYERFTINQRDDIETTVLLLAVGLGVTEIALWGRRQRGRADREAGYIAGIRTAAEAIAASGPTHHVIDVVSDQLTHLLDLRHCEFEYGVAGLGQPARLRPDGHVEWNGIRWDVERDGLPTETEIELLVESNGLLKGRFLMAAAPDSRPTVEQRAVAATLADQVGSAMT